MVCTNTRTSCVQEQHAHDHKHWVSVWDIETRGHKKQRMRAEANQQATEDVLSCSAKACSKQAQIHT